MLYITASPRVLSLAVCLIPVECLGSFGMGMPTFLLGGLELLCCISCGQHSCLCLPCMVLPVADVDVGLVIILSQGDETINSPSMAFIMQMQLYRGRLGGCSLIC